MSDIFDTAVAIIRCQAAGVQEGVKIGLRENEAKIRALLVAYARACLDPAARIPTLLHAACEAFRTKP